MLGMSLQAMFDETERYHNLSWLASHWIPIKNHGRCWLNHVKPPVLTRSLCFEATSRAPLPVSGRLLQCVAAAKALASWFRGIWQRTEHHIRWFKLGWPTNPSNPFRKASSRTTKNDATRTGYYINHLKTRPSVFVGKQESTSPVLANPYAAICKARNGRQQYFWKYKRSNVFVVWLPPKKNHWSTTWCAQTRSGPTTIKPRATLDRATPANCHPFERKSKISGVFNQRNIYKNQSNASNKNSKPRKNKSKTILQILKTKTNCQKKYNIQKKGQSFAKKEKQTSDYTQNMKKKTTIFHCFLNSR